MLISRTLRIVTLATVVLGALVLPAAALADTELVLPVNKAGAKQAIKQIIIDQAPSARLFTVTDCVRRTARKFACIARWTETGADDDYHAAARVTLYLHTGADAKTIEARTLVLRFRSYCRVHGTKCYSLGTVSTPETWNPSVSKYQIAD